MTKLIEAVREGGFCVALGPGRRHALIPIKSNCYVANEAENSRFRPIPAHILARGLLRLERCGGVDKRVMLIQRIRPGRRLRSPYACSRLPVGTAWTVV